MDVNDDFCYVAFYDKCPYKTEEEVIENLKRWFCVNLAKGKKRFGFKNVGTHSIDYVGINGAKERLKPIVVMKELTKRIEYYEKGEVVRCEDIYKTINAWDFYLAHSEEFE